MTFNPDRFLGDEPQPDPRKIGFGFGRRVCPGASPPSLRTTAILLTQPASPGAHFAEVSVMLNLATLLAVFDLELPLDEQGKEYVPDIKWVAFLTRYV